MLIFALALISLASADDLQYLHSAPKPLTLPSMNSQMAPITPDMIQGVCKYQSGWCAGAKVNLKDRSAKIVQSLIISNQESLRFANVRPGVYSLEVVYDHNRKKSVIKDVQPGQQVEIDLDSVAK
jgi:hypothetical protein